MERWWSEEVCVRGGLCDETCVCGVYSHTLGTSSRERMYDGADANSVSVTSASCGGGACLEAAVGRGMVEARDELALVLAAGAEAGGGGGGGLTAVVSARISVRGGRTVVVAGQPSELSRSPGRSSGRLAVI